MTKIIAFVPCRKGSQRVNNKNTKMFSGVEGGLLAIKLTQLLNCKNISQIVVSTNDISVQKIALGFQSSKIKLDIRPENLAANTTSTDDLIQYIP